MIFSYFGFLPGQAPTGDEAMADPLHQQAEADHLNPYKQQLPAGSSTPCTQRPLYPRCRPVPAAILCFSSQQPQQAAAQTPEALFLVVSMV